MISINSPQRPHHNLYVKYLSVFALVLLTVISSGCVSGIRPLPVPVPAPDPVPVPDPDPVTVPTPDPVPVPVPDPDPAPVPDPDPDPVPVPVPDPPPDPVPSDKDNVSILDDRFVIGEVEPVTIKEAGITMPARIDTGAQTSSLGAADIIVFERDGKPWVKFTVKDPKSGKTAEIKSRLVRMARIKRHGGEPIKRPVVKLRAILGPVQQKGEFSLTDRSSFKYPILIGRNFLDGKYIVDVSRKNYTSPMNEESSDER